MPILLKLFQKIANSFYEATITRQRQHRKGKLQANITDEHRCKNPQKSLANRLQQHIKSSYIMNKLGLFQECKDSSIYANQSM